jgi:hypothetical protein
LQAGPGGRPKPDHAADRDTTPRRGQKFSYIQVGTASTLGKGHARPVTAPPP